MVKPMGFSQGGEYRKEGRWTDEERRAFIDGLELHGKDWKKISEMIPSRTIVQIRTHAQKYFQKVAKLNYEKHGKRVPEILKSTAIKTSYNLETLHDALLSAPSYSQEADDGKSFSDKSTNFTLNTKPKSRSKSMIIDRKSQEQSNSEDSGSEYHTLMNMNRRPKKTVQEFSSEISINKKPRKRIKQHCSTSESADSTSLTSNSRDRSLSEQIVDDDFAWITKNLDSNEVYDLSGASTPVTMPTGSSYYEETDLSETHYQSMPNMITSVEEPFSCLLPSENEHVYSYNDISNQQTFVSRNILEYKPTNEQFTIPVPESIPVYDEFRVKNSWSEHVFDSETDKTYFRDPLNEFMKTELAVSSNPSTKYSLENSNVTGVHSHKVFHGLDPYGNPLFLSRNISFDYEMKTFDSNPNVSHFLQKYDSVFYPEEVEINLNL